MGGDPVQKGKIGLCLELGSSFRLTRRESRSTGLVLGEW